MPHISTVDAHRLINVNLYTSRVRIQPFHQVNSDAEFKEVLVRQFADELVKCVDQHKIGSLDTEGKPATALLLGDIHGRVLVINNIPNTAVPTDIKNILQDPSVRWLQSNIEEDIDLLKPYVHISTWVDTALIYRACVDDSNKNRFGRGAQAEFLGQHDFPYCLKTPNQRKPYLCQFDSKKWRLHERCHVAQDARVPIGLALQCAVNYVKDYGYSNETNIVPFLHNFLNSFVIVQHQMQPVRERFICGKKAWLPNAGGQTVLENGCNIVNCTRFVSALDKEFTLFSTDLTTPMFIDPPDVSTLGAKAIAAKNWEGFDFPKDSTKIILGGRFCGTCGGRKVKKCPLRQENNVYCHYPFCSTPIHSHTVKVCKTLHHLCEVCGLRGHYPSAHNDYCAVVLKRVFIKWSPLGLYTSLVYLHPEEKTYWRWHYRGEDNVNNKLAAEANIPLSDMTECDNRHTEQIITANTEASATVETTTRKDGKETETKRSINVDTDDDKELRKRMKHT